MLETFATRFLGIFIEAAPFLVLGSVVSGLIEVFLDRSSIWVDEPGSEPRRIGIRGLAPRWVS